jgi:hypothetical protein
VKTVWSVATECFNTDGSAADHAPSCLLQGSTTLNFLNTRESGLERSDNEMD